MIASIRCVPLRLSTLDWLHYTTIKWVPWQLLTLDSLVAITKYRLWMVPRQFPIMDWSLYVMNIYVGLSVISNIRLSLTMVPPLYEFHFDFNIRQAVERFLTLGCPQ